MIIGIDASRAFVPQATGTEFYSQNLIRALVAQETPARFRLYTRGDSPGEFWGRGQVELRPIPFPRMWTHLRLSAEMLAKPPDSLFVPAHVVPAIHPRASFVTVHDLGYLHFPQAHPFLSRLYLDLSTRWSARVAKTVFADSLATKHDLESYYRVPTEKIIVAYPGFELTDLSRNANIISRYGLSKDYLLAVGTVQPRKNYERLIEAFGALNAGLELVIAGRRGWMAQRTYDRVRELGLRERVKFLDYVPRGDLPALYGNARAFVFPSLYEGFGFPVLEAMASGAPVACSNSSSLPEVGGEAAIYFDPLDVGSMKQALERLINDSTLRQDLAARGRENVKRFTWDACAKIVIKELVRA
ncbi:MAG TPA: glycosyltransferase family 1 protein [Anaerolineae bacterium]